VIAARNPVQNETDIFSPLVPDRSLAPRRTAQRLQSCRYSCLFISFILATEPACIIRLETNRIVGGGLWYL
jgi:hypothetical protein